MKNSGSSLVRIVRKVIILVVTGISCNNKEASVEKAPAYNDALLQNVRTAALTIPGTLPTSINYFKYAESIRKWSEIVDGGSGDPCKMARTAFQIMYPDGWIMVDAGMDRQVHHFFEKQGPQPFNEERAAQVQEAVKRARLIVITHEHGDHVAGVIRSQDSVNRKTILTKAQVATLMDKPQMPEIKLDEARSRNFIVTDFESVLPVAPGVVLIKAPGHTKGEIMVYARLQNGKEYIFTGDVSWSFRGVEQKKGKPESEIKRIGEAEKLVREQLNWLNDLMANKRIAILVSHDDIMLPQYAAQGLIGDSLRLSM